MRIAKPCRLLPERATRATRQATLARGTTRWIGLCSLPGGARPWSVLALGLSLVTLSPLVAEIRPRQPWESLPGAELFSNDAVRQIRIEIAPQGLAKLREDPRSFVRAKVEEAGPEREPSLARSIYPASASVLRARDGSRSGAVYEDVGIHLKGSVGSFREVDDKPALTLDFNRFNAWQEFHGLRRIHLNNSVEDPSYCNEWLGSELFRAAGVPAPRVAHAVVTLNGRRLGLYVLKEGFTEDFLGCYFKQVGGDLYEPGEGHDVNQRLKRNSVQAPRRDRAALRAVAAAALEGNAAERWQRLEQSLDVDEFMTFMVMEVMLGHRDGYCLARNNYRVYENLESGKVVFFPHGMDQLFGNPEAAWQPHMAGLVAKALMETAEGQRRYRSRFACLLTNVFRVQLLKDRVSEVVGHLRSGPDRGRI